VTVGIAFLVVNMALSGDRPAWGGFGGRVGLVEVLGEIDDSDEIVDQIERLDRDASVRAVVVRLDSPGGGVAASQEIYEALGKLHDDKKPVVASLAGVAASGAYYIACAADSIVSNPGTLTGSIGVIMSFPNTEELFRKVGIRLEVIKTGKFKDVGSIWRPMTADERQLLQDVLTNVYDQFVDAIVEGRGMERDDVLPYADGRVRRPARRSRRRDRHGRQAGRDQGGAHDRPEGASQGRSLGFARPEDEPGWRSGRVLVHGPPHGVPPALIDGFGARC
jgi:protease-4